MSGALHLVAMGDGVVIQLPLPASGEVAIGRGKDVDARLDAPSISRRHALLRIENEYEITIEDLGSANGTRVRGQALVKGMPVSLRLGEVADVGALVISIQHHVRTDRARRIWSHAFFEAHLEEACLRIQHAGDAASFAVLGIRGTFDEAVLSAALRPVDVVGLYAPGEYEVILVVDGSPDGSWGRARRHGLWCLSHVPTVEQGDELREIAVPPASGTVRRLRTVHTSPSIAIAPRLSQWEAARTLAAPD